LTIDSDCCSDVYSFGCALPIIKKGEPNSIMAKISQFLKRYFISGILVTVPLVVTYLVLRFLFVTLDSLLNPVVQSLLGYYIPGLGVVVSLLLILLAGIIATNFIGQRIFHLGDRFLTKTPLVRVIYSGAQQLVHSLFAPAARAFSEVAFVEYPRKGCFTLGFLSGSTEVKSGEVSRDMHFVFVPSTPTPISGMVVMLPNDRIHRIDMKIEDAIKLLVSGGIVAPDTIAMTGGTASEEVLNEAG
jgi:uncharacterized membrane protein